MKALFAGPFFGKNTGPVRSVMVGSYLIKKLVVSLFAFTDASVATTMILLSAPDTKPLTVPNQTLSEVFVAWKFVVPNVYTTEATPLESLLTILIVYEPALKLRLSFAGSKRAMVGFVRSLSYLIFTDAVAVLLFVEASVAVIVTVE